MAPKNRSARIRKLATTLSERFGLEYSKHEWIEPEYDERRAEWTLRWTDGPTVGQVTRAARTADKEAVEGVLYERHYSQQEYALQEPRPAHARPGERHGAAPAHGRRQGPWPQLRGGLGHLRPRRQARAILAPRPGRQARRPAAPDPAGVLTARYARGEKQRAWWEHLSPLTELKAFAAVQADPEAAAEAVDAVLALVPDVHAAIDAAVADLRTRVPAPTE